MAMNLEALARGKEVLSNFTHLNVPYQTIKDVTLTTDILIPKDIESGKAPLLIRFHGGFLITGESMAMAIFPSWVLTYALQNSAVLVSPNYLKLPESDGLAILDNLSQFWSWLDSNIQPFVRDATDGKVDIDLTKKLVYGGSAGGYLAIQSALTQTPGTINALILSYAMLDMSSPFFTQSYEKHPYGRPTLDPSLATKFLDARKRGEIIGQVPFPNQERSDLATVAVQQGLFAEFLGPDRRLYPIAALDDLAEKGATVPPIFVFSGREDTAVECKGTERFVEVLREKLPGAQLKVELVEGKEHGFDLVARLEEEEWIWLKKGLEWVAIKWSDSGKDGLQRES